LRESDSTIIGWSTAHDSSAFVELFWRHDAAVHGFLARRAGREVADDLVAEVWLQAFKSRASFDHRSSDARPWLYGIARNLLRSHWRAQARPTPTLPVAVSDPWPDIDDNLDSATRRGELEMALLALTDDEREVLLLVAWEHLTPVEISRVLDLPQSTIRNRLHRARAAMRGQLDSEDHLFDQEA
jgi:RNA polymerase sigma factor (sigma-70 family)